MTIILRTKNFDAGVQFVAENSMGLIFSPDPYTVIGNATLSFTGNYTSFSFSFQIYTFTNCCVFLYKKDIDECASGIAACPPNSMCVNTPGSYNCSCNAGFVANGSLCQGTTTHPSFP
jgi:hypothetical protein